MLSTTGTCNNRTHTRIINISGCQHLLLLCDHGEFASQCAPIERFDGDVRRRRSWLHDIFAGLGQVPHRFCHFVGLGGLGCIRRSSSK